MNPSFKMRISLVVACAVGVGCQSPPVGQDCILIRTQQDGGTTPILEGELLPNQLYLSVGGTQCETGICLRDAGAPGSPPGQAAPGDPAHGYCTTTCSSLGQRCNSVNPQLQLSCQSVVLGAAALADACDAGLDLCRAGGVLRSPDLCSR